jgi:hypothetical protein
MVNQCPKIERYAFIPVYASPTNRKNNECGECVEGRPAEREFCTTLNYILRKTA